MQSKEERIVSVKCFLKEIKGILNLLRRNESQHNFAIRTEKADFNVLGIYIDELTDF